MLPGGLALVLAGLGFVWGWGLLTRILIRLVRRIGLDNVPGNLGLDSLALFAQGAAPSILRSLPDPCSARFPRMCCLVTLPIA